MLYILTNAGTDTNNSCSVACSKAHKLKCAGNDKSTAEPPKAAPTTSASDALAGTRFSDAPTDSPFSKLLEDEQIAYYLRFDSLKVHLRSLCEILNDPKVSGEDTTEGRREVALHKLRELRVGGKESNELVEEFATRVVELLNP